jgi:phage repressor protein C with HTH and peptisase S24 domain
VNQYTALIERLQKGETVQFRPRGNSMKPLIESGSLITVAPASADDLSEGDVAFCRVSGSVYVHLVTAKDGNGRCQISNNRGRVNGWTKAIYGKCVKVEP